MRGRIEALKGAAVGILLHRSFLPLCLLAALVVRLLFIALFDARPLSDFVWYFDKGRDIAAGSGYLVRDDGFPLWEHGKPLVQPRATAFWPVGYPAFLAAIFYATSGLVDPRCCSPSCRTTSRTRRSPAAGLVAAWLAQRPASARSSLHSDPISSAPPPWPEPQPLTPDAPPATVPSRDA